MDGEGLDLSTAASRAMNASEFLALMDRAIERVKAEQTRPQYMLCRTEEEAAWFFGKWGPVPDAPR